MSLKEMQKEVDVWIKKHGVSYWSPHEMLARLTEEVGELAREINFVYGPKVKKANEKKKELKGEIADLLFTIICIANAENIDLDEEFKKTMKKCYERDKDRYKKD